MHAHKIKNDQTNPILGIEGYAERNGIGKGPHFDKMNFASIHSQNKTPKKQDSNRKKQVKRETSPQKLMSERVEQKKMSPLRNKSTYNLFETAESQVQQKTPKVINSVTPKKVSQSFVEQDHQSPKDFERVIRPSAKKV